MIVMGKETHRTGGRETERVIMMKYARSILPILGPSWKYDELPGAILWRTKTCQKSMLKQCETKSYQTMSRKQSWLACVSQSAGLKVVLSAKEVNNLESPLHQKKIEKKSDMLHRGLEPMSPTQTLENHQEPSAASELVQQLINTHGIVLSH